MGETVMKYVMKDGKNNDKGGNENEGNDDEK